MAPGIARLTVAIVLFAFVLLRNSAAQESTDAPRVDLRSLQDRTPPSFTPNLLGHHVSVEGVVTMRSVDLGEYTLLAIQDEKGYGVTIDRERGTLANYLPGDRVRAVGVVAQRGGMPVVHVGSIVKIGSQPAPAPIKVNVRDLTFFENLGRYVTVEGSIIGAGQNSGGDVLVIGATAATPVTVFYPRYSRWHLEGLRSVQEGDRIRITGIATQYCPVQPYDRGFQLLVDDPLQLELLERDWVIPPAAALYSLIAFLASTGIWWTRERRMAAQRRAIHNMMSLSEKVLSSNSISEISRKVQAVLPSVLDASSVDLFLLNKVSNTLDRIPNDAAPEPFVVPLDEPTGSYASAIAICYRNRTLLNIPDFRKSPMAEAAAEKKPPAASVFVPMVAQGEILGVIAVNFAFKPRANPSQQTALQHVANQVAASLKLQEQQSIREQLLRTEKMAAAGQLISGVAHDLRAPLNTIREAAIELRSTRGESLDRLIAGEADRGLQIVNHLLSFARMERSEAQPVNLHQLVSSVMEAREPEWRRKGIRLENAVPISPVEVFADESELEQVVLSLLIHVEHAVENHPGKSIRLSSRVLGSRIQVSIDFSGPVDMQQILHEPTAEDSFGLRVCQAIIQSHGGDIRLFQTPQMSFRYELELPVYHTPAAPELVAEPMSRPSRVLTMILVDQDAAVQRRLLAMMGLRGHRVIPVEQPEEAADMV